MRLLFVSGTTTGGAAASTRQLAAALAARGHDVGFLGQRRSRARSALVAPARSGAWARLAALPARAWRVLQRAAVRSPDAAVEVDGIDTWTSAVPERVLSAVCDAFSPDVVIVNSVHRNAWRSMRAALQRAGIPAVFYVRESSTIEHIPLAELPADATVTNSVALQRSLVAHGTPARLVPSVIDLARCEVASTRDAVLFVNPIASRGLAIALALAAATPDIPFVFQLSWPLDERDERSLHRQLAGHANVELRSYEPRSDLVYRDARVLLLPYRVDQRPRVVAEAQWNRIPVLASDLPGHRDAVGDGGVFVALDAPVAEWAAALRAMWDDARVDELGRRARAHAERADQDAETIVTAFEALMAEVLATAANS